ncbi:MAG: hypothetical protein JWR84_3082 [Caulobacter sp.]|nr:hypothetical protein [Caulobacter sp.]
MDASPNPIAGRLAEVLRLSPSSPAVEFEGAWTDWEALGRAAVAIEALLSDAGVARDAPIGWVARNRPAGVAAFAALVLAGRPVAPLRSNQAPSIFAEDIRSQRLAAIVGDDLDWAIEGAVAAAGDCGTLGVVVSGRTDFVVEPHPDLSRVGPGPHRPAQADMVLERLSSGTTGPPKRVAVDSDTLLKALRSADQASRSRGDEPPLALKTSPAIVLSPFTHAGGVFRLLMSLYQARPIVLLEKFTVAGWLDALRRHSPKTASLVPTMVRMILDADVPPDALAGLAAVRCGTAPLDPETQDAFQDRFGVPVLIDYGAAEFIGGVAGWSLPDHRRFGETKRGSAGRPRPDVQLRTLDPASGAVLTPGEIGQLEIRSVRFGPDWVRTTDLASLDEDGFLYIHGRADDAINRGGFKILPDEVAAVLRQFPGVADAAVLGRPDVRLGQVPVAVIEAAKPWPDAGQISAFARTQLAAYQVPVDYHFVAALPRTTTLKVSRPELRSLIGL